MLDSLKKVLLLPDEVSDVERVHLERVNRIVMGFFALHIPVFMFVAWACDTGVMNAFGLTTLALVGPLVAWKTMPPRTASLVFAFTTMCLGGLLVHFGQGPMQIEMHFYFFVLLGLLAIYANPMVIVVGAATIAVHHLLLYFLLPSSVFNYNASIWVVLVHALFVVLQTPAAIAIARGFFDNVIGLEKIVRERTAALDARNEDMHLLLDNCGQGFLTLDLSGGISAERSAAVAGWLGDAPAGTPFWQLLEERAPKAAMWFELAWESLADGLMPLELCLDQLPGEVRLGDEVIQLDFTPLLSADGDLDRLLVVMTDVTAARARALAERRQQEVLAVFQRVLEDRAGFLEFVDEGERLMDQISDPQTPVDLLQRATHTLKGTSSIFGLETLAEHCHAVESHVVESGDRPDDSLLIPIQNIWSAFRHDLGQMVGEQDRGTVELRPEEYAATLRAVLQGTPHQDLAERIAGWRLETTDQRLERLATQAKRIAARLGKDVDVHVEGHDLRLHPETWSEFWAAFIHAIRNAVDHGVEESGELVIATRTTGDAFVVELRDDGPGVNWTKVKELAEQRGIPHETPQDLQDALFSDGLSTRDEVTETSGRGVGMAALKAVTLQRGGRIEVDSTPGNGTTFRFVFPQDTMAPEPEAMAA